MFTESLGVAVWRTEQFLHADEAGGSFCDLQLDVNPTVITESLRGGRIASAAACRIRSRPVRSSKCAASVGC